MHYLIAVDNSPDAKRAFEFALNNYFTKEDYVYILSIANEITPMEVTPFGDILTSYDDMKDYMEINKQLEDVVKTTLNYYGHQLTLLSIPHTCILAKGSPKGLICREAEKLKVDIVIMGKRRTGKLEKALIGSNSEHCAHHLPCSVLIIP